MQLDVTVSTRSVHVLADADVVVDLHTAVRIAGFSFVKTATGWSVIDAASVGGEAALRRLTTRHQTPYRQ